MSFTDPRTPSNFRPLTVDSGGTGGTTPASARHGLGLDIPIPATSIGYDQSVTATANSVSAKLQQIISVKDAPFNALGDGVTDDTAAAVAAEASLPSAGGKIIFPPGTYLLTNWTPTHNDLVIEGSGRWATVLKGSGAGAAVLNVTGISRLRVSDLKIDGNGVKVNAVDIHATASLTQAVEQLWENVYFTGATTDNLSIGDSGSHQASQINFINCAAWGGTPSNSNIKIQGSNTVGINWFGGQIGSQAITKNVDLVNGQFTTYGPDWNGATGYDVVAASGQFISIGGHSESVAFFNSASADPQTDQSAVHRIDSFQGSTSGATSVYHQAARTLRITASFFNGNVRIGNAAILEGESIKFGGSSGYTNDAGSLNRVRAPLKVTALSASDVDAHIGTGFAIVVRDDTNGGTALVLYENAQTPVIVSSTAGATTFVTGAPAAGQIQVKNRTGNGGVAVLANANRNNAVVTLNPVIVTP